jgi:UDP-N-acetylglucosamine 1-carboxyvinyltransferase
MAGVLAEGITEIHLAATEPHVQDLCNFLKKMGANISGIGTNNLKIKGAKVLKGCRHKIIGDYLEAGTFAIAAAATGGDIVIRGINPDDLNSFWQKFEEMGIKISFSNNSVRIFPSRKLNAVSIKTAVHPGFPTDLQAPFALLLAQAHGVSKVFETLFEGRLNYLVELERMGVRVELLNPHQALIIGPNELKAIPIASGDIRAGAAMVIAALATKGETEISNIDYIDRGYEKIDEKLKKLGANIQRK